MNSKALIKILDAKLINKVETKTATHTESEAERRDKNRPLVWNTNRHRIDLIFSKLFLIGFVETNIDGYHHHSYAYVYIFKCP